MMALAIAAAGAAIALVSATIDIPDSSWEDFKERFDKSYASSEEEAYRRGIFRKNLEFMQTENSKQVGYFLGVNQFADLLTREWASRFFGMVKPRQPYGDVPYLGRHRPSNITLPSSIDWMEKGAVTRIKDQGSCGSCWAFSTTGSLEGAYEIVTGKLISLSEQQLVDCTSSFGEGGCGGGLMDSAFKYAQQTAMCTESSYPYRGVDGTCHASGCITGIPRGDVTGYRDVSTDSAHALMSAVAQQPVSIAIEADKPVFQHYSGGVLSGMCGANLDHGVLVVGYGTDPSGGDYWKVKNSWGKTWGINGYVLLKRGKHGAGECGILKQPSYPVVSASPGPAPGPSPSPPMPAVSHYEKPPCQSDEVEAQLQNTDGELCAPHCDDGAACPSDVPPGTKATPKCILQDGAGNQFCALTCFFSSGCPSGAKCSHVSAFQGVCVYPSSRLFGKLTSLTLQESQAVVNI